MQKRNSSSQETPRLRSGRPLNTTPLGEAFGYDTARGYSLLSTQAYRMPLR